MIAWLVDAAAIISQKALLKCSYAPYARVMKKVCWEESFHILHGRDTVLAMVTGTPEQRELVQEALNRWWEPLMHFHGTPIPAEEDPMVIWRIKSQAQRGGAAAVPRGLRAADPRARPRDPRPEAAPERRTASGSTPSPTGTSCSPSSPATGRRRRSGSSSAGSRAPRRTGSRRWSSRRRRDLGGLQAGAEGPAVHARRLVPRAGQGVRRRVRARVLRAAAGVGGALGRAARGDHGDRGVPGRVRPQVPPRRRLLDQGAAEGGS